MTSHKVIAHSPQHAGMRGSAVLAQLIGAAELSKAVADGTFIKRGEAKCVEGVKYDFRLSNRVLKSSFVQPAEADELTPEDRRKLLVVEPGEMVFVLSEETLDLPSNMIAQLSPKRRLSHDGIAVMGGFCIDPLYKGHLVIGLHNLSAAPFSLLPGRKLIAAIFLRLETDEVSDFPTPAPLFEFPEELIRVMRNYQPTSPAALQTQLQTVMTELAGLRSIITSREEWYKNIEGAISGQKDRINDLIIALTKEAEARGLEDKVLAERLTQQSTSLATQGTVVDAINRKLNYQTAIIAVVGVAVTIVVGIVTAIFSSWMGDLLKAIAAK